MLVVLPPIGVSHPYLTTLWYQICFWRQAVTTAKGQAEIFWPAFCHTCPFLGLVGQGVRRLRGARGGGRERGGEGEGKRGGGRGLKHV